MPPADCTVFQRWDSVPDPADPRFAPIRADLARLLIAHKADLGLTDWTDDKIVDHVTWIASALIACGMVALQRGDRAWLERHRRFGEANERLFADRHAVPLDA
jgi:hypothetical protein